MPNPDLTNQIMGKNGVSKTIAFAISPGTPPGIVGRMFIRPYTWNCGGRGEWAGHLGYDVDGKGTD